MGRSDSRGLNRTFALGLMLFTAWVITACGGGEEPVSDVAAPSSIDSSTSVDAAAAAYEGSLATILAAQSSEVRARYGARHPKETLEFFEIELGMTVVEALPEGGWYTRILHAYLGTEAMIIGADYALDMYPLFDFYSAEELAAKAVWAKSWPQELAQWPGEGAEAAAFNFGSLSSELQGSADRVLFIRALHNVASFESSGGYLSTAIADSYAILKPGGLVGVVQHMGPESHSDAWADGSNGYLKKSTVIAAFESAGFELEAQSAVNENPKDIPTEDEYVWRLAPTLEAVDDEALASKYKEIGESSRMTLRFRKPVGR